MINNKMEYLYKKQFKYDLNGSLLLMNPETLQEYNKEKAYLLYSFSNDSEKQLLIKKQIINEFEKIYEYDLVNAELPELFGAFKSEEEKEQLKKEKLFTTDFYSIIGNIFAGYLELLIKYNKPHIKVIIPSTIINYKELYELGIHNLLSTIKYEIEIENLKGTRYELLIPKENQYAEKVDEYGNPLIVRNITNNNIITMKGNHAYLASYTFPTLIEFFLGIHLRNKLLYESLDKLKSLIDNNKVSLLDNENKLYDIFSKRGDKTILGNEIDSMTELYNMFVKYNVFKDSLDYKMILVGESKSDNKKLFRTLGGIIKSKYANKVIIPEYMKLIKWLFDIDYLNIRNNTMHGNNINYDYFGICFPCIMLSIIWDIGTGDIFIK